MGGFSDEALSSIEDQGDEGTVSMYATEVAHLREVCESQGKQVSVARSEIELLEMTLLGLTDRVRYYGEAIKLEDLEHLMALTKTARRTLE